jgi:hypothetical protein
MAEIKYDTSHHAGATPEARIANRLRNSGGDEADHVVQKGSGPTRAFTNVHEKGNVMQRGKDHPGEGDIFNRPRGVANPKGQIP